MVSKGNYELLIQKLDGFIRKFYLNKLLRGALYFTGMILAAYLFISLTEYKLYFSTIIRKLLLGGFFTLFLGAFYYWIVRPLTAYLKLGKTISHEQAAQIIGTHFENVQDKLLNILQLKHQREAPESKELIEASIDQKMDQIKLVPFAQAIDLKQNKRYLKYALPPLGIFIFLLFAAPSILKESNFRLANPNRIFPKKAPFEFYLENKSLKISQFDNITIKLKTDGKVLPNEVYVETKGKEFKMQKTDVNHFEYTYSNVQESFSFNFISAEFNSASHKVKVIPKPLISGLSANINYPSYTGRKNETLQNVSDLNLPEGTVVSWDFKANNTDFINIRAGQKLFETQKQKNGHFLLSQRFMTDAQCTILIGNKESAAPDSLFFNIAVTPDQVPSIYIEKIADSTDLTYLYFVGNIADDYGFTKLLFHYLVKEENDKIKEAKVTNLSFDKGLPALNFTHVFDASKIALSPGDKLEYYFEVLDNDGVHGPKSAKSSTYVLDKPSKEELKKIEEQNNEDIKDNLADAQKQAEQFSKDVEEMKEKVLTKKNFDWQDKKAIEDLLKEQKELQQKLESVKKDLQENQKNQDEFKKTDDDLKEKQEKLQKMMDELMTDEMKDMLKKLEELLQNLDQKNAFEKLDQFQMSSEDLKTELDKLQSLFEKLEFEQKVNETIQKLEDLAKQEEELSQKTNEGKDATEDLKKEQEDVQKQFDEVKKNLDDLEKKNKEQGSPLDMPKNEKQSEEIKDEMQESQESLDKKENQKAGASQKSASEKMKKMAQSMQAQMDKAESDDNAEDMATIRQLLENLVKMSFDQESLMSELKKTETESPRYVQLMQKQYEIKDDADMIKDSLIELSKRQFQIESFVKDELHKLDREMKKTLKSLEDRNKPEATSSQQFIMTSTNNLALMLDESLQDMQQQMNNSKPGNGSCKKPGGEGMGLPQLKQMQKELNDKLGKMQGEMKGGKSPREMGKDFAEAAQKQAEIREALRKIKEGMSQEEKNGSGVDKMMDQMDKTETDLVNKRLTDEMLKRQQEILTKMLDFEDAKHQQDMKDDRKSKTATDIPHKIPPAIEEYLRKKQAEMDIYRTVPPSLKPFYKQLVEKYYQSLN